MSKIYWDRFAREYTKRKDPYAPPERYATVVSTTEEGLYSVTYKSAEDSNQVITFQYEKEAIEAIGFNMLIEQSLARNGLTFADIDTNACRYGFPPSEYKKIEEELE